MASRHDIMTAHRRRGQWSTKTGLARCDGVAVVADSDGERWMWRRTCRPTVLSRLFSYYSSAKQKVNARDNDGRTPFLNASESGNCDLVRQLLNYNSDEHVRNNMGNTPLHHAAFDSHIELVRILLERNVEANAWDDERSTPLHYATQREPEVAQVILVQRQGRT
ncbi:ankyrin repeat-containing domain protein [Lactarius hengduanensis]|nr:ankyrin repeat-containing domain protein [Lactarius hengduanensis]